MNSSRSLKYKALFLLVTFSLNTVVGFACSLGIDMGVNSAHHEHDEDQPNPSDKHCTGAQEKDHHEKHNLNHIHTTGYIGNDAVISASEDDNCCSGFVSGFQSLDKQLVEKSYPVKVKIAVAPFVIHSILKFQNIACKEPVRIPPKIPGYSPPDIRVFIQSFLI